MQLIAQHQTLFVVAVVAAYLLLAALILRAATRPRPVARRRTPRHAAVVRYHGRHEIGASA